MTRDRSPARAAGRPGGFFRHFSVAAACMLMLPDAPVTLSLPPRCGRAGQSRAGQGPAAAFKSRVSTLVCTMHQRQHHCTSLLRAACCTSDSED